MNADMTPRGQISPADARNLTQLVYLLQALALVNGFTVIAGVFVNLIKREAVQGTLYESHFNWQLKTVLYTLLGFAVSGILCLIVIGFFLMPVVVLWYIYRVVKGWLALNDGKELQSGLF